METKLIDNVKKAASLVGLSAGFGFIMKTVFKKHVTSDPSSNLMNFGTWVGVMTGSIYAVDYLIKEKIIPS